MLRDAFAIFATLRFHCARRVRTDDTAADTACCFTGMVGPANVTGTERHSKAFGPSTLG
jgi:hypothetical protein